MLLATLVRQLVPLLAGVVGRDTTGVLKGPGRGGSKLMFEDDWMFRFVFGHLHAEIKLAVEACHSPRTQTKILELLIIDGKIEMLDT
jgi:hypothetical protein